MKSYAEIEARTKALVASGKPMPVFPEHSGGKPIAGLPAIQSEPVGDRCGYLGKRLTSGCRGTPIYVCDLFKTTCSRFVKCDQAVRHCETCTSDTRKQPALLTLDTKSVRFNSEYGVCIGSYGWPELIDLQCRLIRATCGEVPVYVSSDEPKDAARLKAICDSHPDVTLSVNAQRIGHTGGDVAAYWKAVVWGGERGLKVVAKLSQRFFCTVPNWLQSGATELLRSGLPLSTQKCTGRNKFDLRTEAALIDVKQWARPEVLDLVRPREYWKDRPAGLSAESVIFRALQDAIGGYFWPWALFGEERFREYPGVVWHCSHTVADYRALAAKYGVRLSDDFHTDGWQRDLKNGKYKYG